MSHSTFQASRFWFIVLGTTGALLATIVAAVIAIYAGLYNVAADIPHTQPVYWLLKTVRERSVAVRAAAIDVPGDLDRADRIAKGAGQYADMCANCHLAPGMKRTEMSRGIYPRAPELRRGGNLTTEEQFWIVKHGVKATGMPAWGVTHSDDMLWDIVAFLRKLPELSPEEYRALTEKAPSHDEIMKETEEKGADDGEASHAH